MEEVTNINSFCRAIPKIELHAHLNGSLSHATMLELKRYHADSGLKDTTNAFFDEFQIGTGDTRSIYSDCFQVFSIAHNLTTTPEALALATTLTLQEFQNDGCCYIELRSTPRDTQFMTKRKYIEALVDTLIKSSEHFTMISRLLISIDRRFTFTVAEETTNLAIEYYKKFPNVIVGIELSGDPTVGAFRNFIPLLQKARNEGLKISLHCGEVSNPEEVKEMLEFQPERIGHGVCIHPNYGGTQETWAILNQLKIPVEVCLSSNVKTKITSDYDAHHFKEFYEAGIPIIICTDDKGVFSTSLSQEYILCAETFGLDQSEIVKLLIKSCQCIFSQEVKETVLKKILNFSNMINNVSC